MLTMAEERDVTQSVKVLRATQIVCSGIVGGAVFYAYSGNPAKLSEDTVLLVRMILAGLSVLVFLAGRIMKRNLLSKGREKFSKSKHIVTVRQKCKVYISASIMEWSILGTMNTYGVVFYLLSQNIIDMIFIPVFVFIMIFLFPKNYNLLLFLENKE